MRSAAVLPILPLLNRQSALEMYANGRLCWEAEEEKRN